MAEIGFGSAFAGDGLTSNDDFGDDTLSGSFGDFNYKNGDDNQLIIIAAIAAALIVFLKVK